MDNKLQFTPVKQKKSSELIYEQIKQQIINATITPGEKLPTEKEMVEMFKVSHPTVREAVRLLESEGYVLVIQGGGVIVKNNQSDTTAKCFRNLLEANNVSYLECLEFCKCMFPKFVNLFTNRINSSILEELSSTLEKEKVYSYDLDRTNHEIFCFLIILLKNANNHLMMSMNEMMISYFESTGYKITDRVILDKLLLSQYSILESLKEQDIDVARIHLINFLDLFSLGTIYTSVSEKKTLFSPIVTEKVSILVYEQIKNQITSGNLKPGDALPSERTLVETFNRSRPTIREALKMLESENLITIRPGAKTIVNDIHQTYLDYSFKYLLENDNIQPENFNEVNRIRCKCYSELAAQRMSNGERMKLNEYISLWLSTSETTPDIIYKEMFHLLDYIASASNNRIFVYVNQVFNYSTYLIISANNTLDYQMLKKAFENYVSCIINNNTAELSEYIDILYDILLGIKG